jgi:hypothetical protein
MNASTSVRTKLPDKALGQVDRRHGVGEKQLADFGERRATIGCLDFGALDPGIDEQQIEDLALELLAQGDDGLLIVHVELFDAHIAQGLQGLGFLRGAYGGGDLPTIGQQGFHQPEAEAEAEAAGGADDECGFCRGHGRGSLEVVSESILQRLMSGVECIVACTGPIAGRPAPTGFCGEHKIREHR